MSYIEGALLSIEFRRITYTRKDPGIVKRKISLTLKGEIPKNSASPPQTPNIDLFLDDLLSLFLLKYDTPPMRHSIFSYLLTE